MPNQTLVTEDGTQLDPKVVKVMRAIRQVESPSGDYNAVGDNGSSFGAFQFNEKTGPGWKNLAKQYLGDENAVMDKGNQNKVAYFRIKQWKDEGKQPEEIAALWNGASKGPDGRYTYNNPQYGEKFRAALGVGNQAHGFVNPQGTSLIQGSAPGSVQAPQVDVTRENSPKEGFAKRFSKGTYNVLKDIEKPFAGVAAIPVQAFAKAIGQEDPYKNFAKDTGLADVTPLNFKQKAGDIAQVGSYFVPGTGLASAVGAGALQGAGMAASEGKSGKQIIGGGALGAGVGAAAFGATKLIGKGIEKAGEMVGGQQHAKLQTAIKNEYGRALNLNASARAYEKRTGKELAEVLLEHNAPLERYENGTVNTTKAIETLENALELLNKEANRIIKTPQGVVYDIELPKMAERFGSAIDDLPLSQFDRDALKDKANKYLAAEIKKHGTNVSIEVADKIKSNMWKTVGKAFDRDTLVGEKGAYQVGKALQEAIEETVEKTDTNTGLRALNAKRGNLLDAIRRLTKIDGVNLVPGRRLGNLFGGVEGAIAGAASGFGIPGVLMGDYFGTEASKVVQNPAFRIGAAKKIAGAAGYIPKAAKAVLGKKGASAVSKGLMKLGTKGVGPASRIGTSIGNVLSQ